MEDGRADRDIPGPTVVTTAVPAVLGKTKTGTRDDLLSISNSQDLSSENLCAKKLPALDMRMATESWPFKDYLCTEVFT